MGVLTTTSTNLFIYNLALKNKDGDVYRDDNPLVVIYIMLELRRIDILFKYYMSKNQRKTSWDSEMMSILGIFPHSHVTDKKVAGWIAFTVGNLSSSISVAIKTGLVHATQGDGLHPLAS